MIFKKKKQPPAPRQQLPALYTEAEMNAVDAHIKAQFGEYAIVLHETVAFPDIHLDVCVVDPTPERNFYTLVTMGVGAHRMNVPKELRARKLERAELLLCLPPDWKLQVQDFNDEHWYWPVRLLKNMARLPAAEDDWLGYGHTVDNDGAPYAENTELCGALLTIPVNFGKASYECNLPGGDVVNFYQLLPLYKEEMAYKLDHEVEDLLFQSRDFFHGILNPAHPNAIKGRKDVRLQPTQMKFLLPDWEGRPHRCLCTARITVDGLKVGYMTRDLPQDGTEDLNSGWAFFADYLDIPDYEKDNAGIYDLNEIANYDPEIIPFLDAPYGSVFERDDDGVFQAVDRD